MGPCGGIATAHADADVALADLRRAEARGFAFIFLLLPFQTCQHSELLFVAAVPTHPQTAKQVELPAAAGINRVHITASLYVGHL